MKITIPITREHITKAEMVSSERCVIARAIRDVLPLAEFVSIGIDKGHIRHYDECYPHPLYIPKRTQRFIEYMVALPKFLRFLVRQRTFELDVPEHFVAKEPVRPELIETDEECKQWWADYTRPRKEGEPCVR